MMKGSICLLCLSDHLLTQLSDGTQELTGFRYSSEYRPSRGMALRVQRRSERVFLDPAMAIDARKDD